MVTQNFIRPMNNQAYLFVKPHAQREEEISLQQIEEVRGEEQVANSELSSLPLS